MGTMKYSVIKDKAQYDAYCSVLETLLESDPVDSEEVEFVGPIKCFLGQTKAVGQLAYHFFGKSFFVIQYI